MNNAAKKTNGMKSFEIREQGQVFTRVMARTGESALRKAHKAARKVGSEAYDGWEGEETWYARSDDDVITHARVRITPNGTQLLAIGPGR